ncbi:hypothetical protein Tco_1456203 [Tanacetum coccineum]
MEECKTNLDETNRALGEATSCRDSCLIALQNKQNEFEKYKAFNDRTIDYDILQNKVLNQKHDELVKKSLLTKSQLEGRLKEKTKVILDLKVKEEKDIDKMIEMDKQLKFLNEIVYTRNQSIQTIHMLAPKCSTYNGRPTFANPRFAPNREETMTLANESRSKLNKDYVKPYDYTKQNSLYEIFKAPSLEYLYQLERAKEVRKTMWRKPFNLPKIRKQAVRSTNVIAPGPSRNHPKHVSFQSPKEFVGSNDMVHNYYLEKAKKSAQLQKDKDVNGKPSMINPARLPNTANGCKPKPRNWQASMSSRVSNKDVHIEGEHRKQKPFLKSNDLRCPTCKKCLFSANHDECV